MVFRLLIDLKKFLISQLLIKTTKDDLKNTDLFESIFKEILARATKCGFVDSSNIYIDSTHIKASANKKKYTKVEVDIQAKHYQEKLEKEINEDRVKHGKSPLCEAKIKEVKKKKK